MLHSCALRLRALPAFRINFFDERKCRGLLLSFVRRRRRAWRDVVVVVLVDDDPVSFLSLGPDGFTLVLRNESEDEDSQLSLEDFFRAVAMPSVRVPVRMCDLVTIAYAGLLGGARVPASPATDSLDIRHVFCGDALAHRRRARVQVLLVALLVL